MINKDNKPNKLIQESSPYLLQHAYNPVEWFPWGDEALSKAKKEKRSKKVPKRNNQMLNPIPMFRLRKN